MARLAIWGPDISGQLYRSEIVKKYLKKKEFLHYFLCSSLQVKLPTKSQKKKLNSYHISDATPCHISFHVVKLIL